MKNILPHFRILALVFVFAMTLRIDAWAHFGPRSPLGGYVTCATSNNGFVYLGTENGGVYESTSAGLTQWRPRPVGLLSGKVTALTHTGSYLFAGTADGGIFIFTGFVGADRYWNKVNNGLGNLQIQSLVAVDSITVLAGTNGGGLYKTTDKGANWTAVNDVNLNNAVVTSLEMGGGRCFATTQSGGVFASDNGGNTWFGFNDVNTQMIGGTVAMSYNDTTDVLMVLNMNGLYTAGNASVTMSPTYTGANTGLPLGTNVRALSNNGTNWVCATSMGVYSSSSMGINWSASNTGLASTDATAIVALPANLIVAVHKTGIYKSPATGISWTFTNTGFNNPVTHSMAMGGDSLVIAVTSEGVFVSRKLGSPATTFVRSNNGLTDSTHVMDIVIAKDQLWAATPSGIFMSQDTGGSWMAMNVGLSNVNIQRLFYGNNMVYAFDNIGGVHARSIVSGNWTSVQTGLPVGVSPSSMAFYGNRILLGTMGDGVYMKDQNGASWMAFNTGLTNMDVTSVAAASGRFYAGTDGNGVFSTMVDSAAWTATSATSISHTTMLGLDGDNIQAMSNYAGYVYASYRGGLLATSDEGQLWEEGGNQFNLPSYTNVKKIGFVTSRVFALTENNGPYANGLSELPVLPNFLAVSDDLIMVPQQGRNDFVTVTSNVPWTLVSSDPWITVLPGTGFRDGTLEIVTAANTGPMRTGEITISSDSLSQAVVIEVMQDGAVATGSPAIQGDFQVLPNPNNGRFILDFSDLGSTVYKASILDLNGKLVEEWVVNGPANQLEAKLNAAAGTYLIRLETADGVRYKRLLINY